MPYTPKELKELNLDIAYKGANTSLVSSGKTDNIDTDKYGNIDPSKFSSNLVSINDISESYQTGMDKFANGLLQGTETFGSAIINGVASVASLVYATGTQLKDLFTGEDKNDFMDNWLRNDLMKGLNELDETFKTEVAPIRLTEEQQKDPFAAASLWGGFANGVGFLASAIIPTGIISKLTTKPLQMAYLANLAELANAEDKAFKLLSKAEKLKWLTNVKTGDKLDDIVSKIQKLESTGELEAGASQAYLKYQKTLSFKGDLAGSIYSRIGESQMEAYDTYKQIMEKNQYKVDNGEITEEQLHEIASSNSNKVFGTNMLLSLMEFKQYRSILKGGATLPEIFLEKGLAKGINMTKMARIGKGLTKIGVQSVSEGTEELLQFGMQEAAKKLADNQIIGKDDSYLVNMFKETIEGLSKPEGQVSALLGAVLGGGMTGYQQATSKENDRHVANSKQAADLYNKYTNNGEKLTDDAFVEKDGKIRLSKEILSKVNNYQVLDALKNKAKEDGDKVGEEQYGKLLDSFIVTNKIIEGNYDEHINMLKTLQKKSKDAVKQELGLTELKTVIDPITGENKEIDHVAYLEDKIQEAKEYKQIYDNFHLSDTLANLSFDTKQKMVYNAYTSHINNKILKGLNKQINDIENLSSNYALNVTMDSNNPLTGIDLVDPAFRATYTDLMNEKNALLNENKNVLDNYKKFEENPEAFDFNNIKNNIVETVKPTEEQNKKQELDNFVSNNTNKVFQIDDEVTTPEFEILKTKNGFVIKKGDTYQELDTDKNPTGKTFTVKQVEEMYKNKSATPIGNKVTSTSKFYKVLPDGTLIDSEGNIIPLTHDMLAKLKETTISEEDLLFNAQEQQEYTEEEVNALNQEILTKELERLNEELKNNNTEEDSTSNQIKTVSDNIANIKKVIAKLTDKVSKLKVDSKATKLKDALLDALIQAEELEKELTNLENRQKELSTTNELIKKKIETYTKYVGENLNRKDLEDKLKQYEQLNDRLIPFIESLKKSIVEIRESIKSLYDLIEALINIALRQPKNNWDGSNEELLQQEDKLKNLNAQEENLLAQIEDKEQVLEQYNNIIDDLLQLLDLPLVDYNLDFFLNINSKKALEKALLNFKEVGGVFTQEDEDIIRTHLKKLGIPQAITTVKRDYSPLDDFYNSPLINPDEYENEFEGGKKDITQLSSSTTSRQFEDADDTIESSGKWNKILAKFLEAFDLYRYKQSGGEVRLRIVTYAKNPEFFSQEEVDNIRAKSGKDAIIFKGILELKGKDSDKFRYIGWDMSKVGDPSDAVSTYLHSENYANVTNKFEVDEVKYRKNHQEALAILYAEALKGNEVTLEVESINAGIINTMPNGQTANVLDQLAPTAKSPNQALGEVNLGINTRVEKTGFIGMVVAYFRGKAIPLITRNINSKEAVSIFNAIKAYATYGKNHNIEDDGLSISTLDIISQFIYLGTPEVGKKITTNHYDGLTNELVLYNSKKEEFRFLVKDYALEKNKTQILSLLQENKRQVSKKTLSKKDKENKIPSYTVYYLDDNGKIITKKYEKGYKEYLLNSGEETVLTTNVVMNNIGVGTKEEQYIAPTMFKSAYMGIDNIVSAAKKFRPVAKPTTSSIAKPATNTATISTENNSTTVGSSKLASELFNNFYLKTPEVIQDFIQSLRKKGKTDLEIAKILADVDSNTKIVENLPSKFVDNLALLNTLGEDFDSDTTLELIKLIDKYNNNNNNNNNNPQSKSEETTASDKKADIERRRQEELPIINVYWGSAETTTNTRLLSNLAPRKFTYKGKEYGSVEHAYQTLKSGEFDQITYDKYVKAGGYGTKIRGKQVNKGFDNLQLMKDLVVESFKQNPEQSKLLLKYKDFTHTTNEVIDKAFLEGLKLAKYDAELAVLEKEDNFKEMKFGVDPNTEIIYVNENDIVSGNLEDSEENKNNTNTDENNENQVNDEEVDFDSIDRLLNGAYDNIENFEKAKEWFYSRFPKTIPFEKVAKLIRGKAMGNLMGTAVAIWELAEEGTGFHEAFHVAFRLFASPKEREQLIKEVNSLEGYGTTYKGDKKLYSAFTAKEAEEHLAEQFRELVLNNGEVKTKQFNFLTKMWRTFKDLLEHFFTRRSYKDIFFQKIQEGYYTNAKIRKDAFIGSADRKLVSKEGNVKSTEFTKNILGAMDMAFINTLPKDKSITDFLTGNIEDVADIYDKIYKYFTLTRNTSVYKEGKFSVEYLDYMLDKENYENIVQEHVKSLESFGIIVEFDTYEGEENFLETLEEIKNDELTLGRGAGDFEKAAITINPKQTLTQKIKLLLHFNYQTNKEGKTIFNPKTGLPVKQDGKVTYLKLLNGLEGLDSYEDMQKAILEMTKNSENSDILSFARLAGILTKEGTIAPIDTLAKFYFGQQFRAGFSKSLVNALAIKEYNDTSTYTVDLIFQKFRQGVINRAKNAFKYQSDNSKKVTLQVEINDKKVNKDFELVDIKGLMNTFFGKKDNLLWEGQHSYINLLYKLTGIVVEGAVLVDGYYSMPPTKLTSDLKTDIKSLIMTLKNHHENTVYTLDDILNGGIRDAKGIKQKQDFNGRITNIIRYNFENNKKYSLMYNTPEGKTAYGIALKNFYNLVVDSLKRGILPDHLNSITNPYVTNAVTLKKFLANGTFNLKVHLNSGNINHLEDGFNNDAQQQVTRVKSALNFIFSGQYGNFKESDKSSNYLFEFGEFMDFNQSSSINMLWDEYLAGYLQDEIAATGNTSTFNTLSASINNIMSKDINEKDSLEQKYTKLKINKNKLLKELGNAKFVEKVKSEIKESLDLITEDTVNYLSDNNILIKSPTNDNNFLLLNGITISEISNNNIDNKNITNEQVTKLIKYAVVNNLIAKQEISKLFIGNPNQFKDFTDLVKRNGSTAANKLFPDVSEESLALANELLPRLDGKPITDKIQVAIKQDSNTPTFTAEQEEELKRVLSVKYAGIKDKEQLIEKEVEAYKKENIQHEDGFAAIRPEMYRQFMNLIGRWDSIKETAWQNMMNGKSSSFAFPVEKLQYSYITEDGKTVVLKFSVLPLFDSYLANTEHNFTPEELASDMIVYDSSQKIFKLVGDNNMLPLKGLGVQVDNVQKGSNKVSIITQLERHLTAVGFNRGIASEAFLKAKNIINRAKGAIININNQENLKRIGISENGDIIDARTLVNYLIDAAGKSALPENTKEQIKNLLYDSNNVIKPLSTIMDKDRLYPIIQSIFGGVIKYKKNGQQLVQVPNIFGYELGFYTNKDGKKVMQVVLPYIFKGKMDAGLLTQEDLITMIAARIPVEGLGSIELIEAVGFLPPSMGNSIVLPNGITIKSGTDYDFDKLNVYYPTVDNDNNYLQYYETPNQEEIEVLFREYAERQVKLEQKYIQLKKLYDDRVSNKKVESHKKLKEFKIAQKDITNLLNELYENKQPLFVKKEEKEVVYKAIQSLKEDLKNADEIIANTNWEDLDEVLQGLKDKKIEIQQKYDLLNTLVASSKEFKNAQEEFKQWQQLYKEAKQPFMDELAAIKKEYEESVQALKDEYKDKYLRDFNKLSIEEQNGIDRLNNLLLKEYIKLLSTEEALSESLSPNDVSELKDISRKFQYKNPLLAKFEKAKKALWLGLVDILTNEEQATANNIAKAQVGTPALHSTNNSLGQTVDLSIKLNAHGFEELKDSYDKDGYISIGRKYDNQGNLMVKRIADFIGGFVDAAKDTWVFDLLLTPFITDVAVILTRAGISRVSLAVFINQPVIKLLNSFNTLTSEGLMRTVEVDEDGSLYFSGENLETKTQQIKDVLIEIINTNKKDNEKLEDLLEKVNKYKFKDLSNSKNWDKTKEGKLAISSEKITQFKDLLELFEKSDDKVNMAIEQLAILNQFLALKEDSKQVLDMLIHTNYDTAGVGATPQFIEKKANRTKELMVDPFFKNLDKLIEDTYLDDIFNYVQTVPNKQKELSILQNPIIKEFFAPLLSKYEKYGEKRFANIIKTLENHLMYYIVSTNKSEFLNGKSLMQLDKNGQPNAYLASIVEGIKYDLTNPVGAYQSLLNSHKNKKYYPLLNNLMGVKTDESINGNFVTNIVSVNSFMEALESDELTDSWDELFADFPDLAHKLVLASFIQAGFGNTPTSFNKLIPANILNSFVNSAFENFKTDYLDNGAGTRVNDYLTNFLIQFYQNNAFNKDFVNSKYSRNFGGKLVRDVPFILISKGKKRFELWYNTGQPAKIKTDNGMLDGFRYAKTQMKGLKINDRTRNMTALEYYFNHETPSVFQEIGNTAADIDIWAALGTDRKEQPVLLPSNTQLNLFENNTIISNTVTFQEEPSSGYAKRTIKNASADATIALAFDFTSAGERLTRSSVEGQNKKYIGIVVPSKDKATVDLQPSELQVNRIVDDLNSVNAKTLNIAGNGIYTMRNAKYSQKDVDLMTYNLLKKVIESPNLKNKIKYIRTGGQTGFDEAGAKAAIKLGIPTLILAPKGWTFRNINGQDISNEQSFKARFNLKSETTKEDLIKQYADKVKTNNGEIITKKDILETIEVMGIEETTEWLDKCTEIK